MTPAPLPQRRRTGVVAAGAIGSLGIAAAAVFGVHAAIDADDRRRPGIAGAGRAPRRPASSPATGPAARPAARPRPAAPAAPRPRPRRTTASAAQQVGIVEINTVLQYQDAQAAGTGMVLTSDGEILTNNHVVDGATSISVTISSTGATYAATVVGTDPTDDVAVLQLTDASGLQTAKLSTAAATVGDAVTGVGNAGGTGTLTAATGHGHRARPVDHRHRRDRRRRRAADRADRDRRRHPGRRLRRPALRRRRDDHRHGHGRVVQRTGRRPTPSRSRPPRHRRADRVGRRQRDDPPGLPGLPRRLDAGRRDRGRPSPGCCPAARPRAPASRAGDVITSVDGTTITLGRRPRARRWPGDDPGDRVSVTWTTPRRDDRLGHRHPRDRPGRLTRPGPAAEPTSPARVEVGFSRAAGCDDRRRAPVAQWIERQTSNLLVAGSNPAGRAVDGAASEPARGHDRPMTDRRLPAGQPAGRGRAAVRGVGGAVRRIDLPAPDAARAGAGLARCGRSGPAVPSVPAWLAGQVGTSGRVLATDIDTRWLDGTPGRRGRAPRRRSRARSGRAVRPGARPPAAGARARPRAARSSAWRRPCGRADGWSSRTPTRRCSPWSAWRTRPRRGAGQPAQGGVPPAARRPRRRPRLRPHAAPPPAGDRPGRRGRRRLLPDHRAGLQRTRARQRRADPRPTRSTTASRPPPRSTSTSPAVATRSARPRHLPDGHRLGSSRLTSETPWSPGRTRRTDPDLDRPTSCDSSDDGRG